MSKNKTANSRNQIKIFKGVKTVLAGKIKSCVGKKGGQQGAGLEKLQHTRSSMKSNMIKSGAGLEKFRV